MTSTISFLTASVFAAGIAFGPVQAQDVSAKEHSAMAEALILAQLQIEGSADGTTAAAIAARVVDALADQGYRVVDVSRTFLGRLRIVAESVTDRREVIVSQTTGAVLRDRITATFEVGVSSGATAGGAISDTGNTSGGSTVGLTGGVGLDVRQTVGIGTSGGSTAGGTISDTGNTNGGSTVGLTGGVGLDVRQTIGIGASGGSSDSGTENSVGGSVSVGLGG